MAIWQLMAGTGLRPVGGASRGGAAPRPGEGRLGRGRLARGRTSSNAASDGDTWAGIERIDVPPTDHLVLFLGWVFCIMLMAVLGLVIAAAFAVSGRRQLVTIGQLSASGTDPAVLRRYLALQGTWSGALGVAVGMAVGLWSGAAARRGDRQRRPHRDRHRRPDGHRGHRARRRDHRRDRAHVRPGRAPRCSLHWAAAARLRRCARTRCASVRC